MSTHCVIDCFLFYNEIDLALYRLKVLWNTVKYFVISESSFTFMGKPKPFYLNNRCFDEFRSKIISIQLNDLPYEQPNVERSEQWHNEMYQRNALEKGIKHLVLNGSITESDLILLNDVDEIPDINSLNDLCTRDYIHDKIYVLRQKYHCYSLENIRDQDWYHAKIISIQTWIKMQYVSFEQLRLYGVKLSFPSEDVVPELIVYGGWHLSYFGDIDFIKNKLKNFSHQELIVNDEDITERVNNGKDIMGNPSINFRKVLISTNTYLPPDFESLLSFSCSSIN